MKLWPFSQGSPALSTRQRADQPVGSVHVTLIPETRYAFGNGLDEVLWMDRDLGGNPQDIRRYFMHQDGLGSVVATTVDRADPQTETLNVAERYVYSAYGEVSVYQDDWNSTSGAYASLPTGHSSIWNPYLYTGQRYDSESGLFYYKNRMYDPRLGRFLSRDPLGYSDGPSLYQYARSSPVDSVDSLGLWSIQEENREWWALHSPIPDRDHIEEIPSTCPKPMSYYARYWEMDGKVKWQRDAIYERARYLAQLKQPPKRDSKAKKDAAKDAAREAKERSMEADGAVRFANEQAANAWYAYKDSLKEGSEDYDNLMMLVDSKRARYLFEVGPVSGDDGGEVTYDGDLIHIVVAPEDDPMSLQARIAQEVQHAADFERGYWGFARRGKKWVKFAFELTDEVSGWNASLRQATPFDTTPGRLLYRYDRANNKKTFLRKIPKYRDLKLDRAETRFCHVDVTETGMCDTDEYFFYPSRSR